MSLYRIHQRLLVNRKAGTFVEPGGACTLDMIGKDKIKLLLDIGAISLVRAPPLSVFTHWRGRAAKLAELGIDTIGFVTMDARDVAYAIRASVTDDVDQGKVDRLTLAVERWQGEIRKYLGIDSARVRR